MSFNKNKTNNQAGTIIFVHCEASLFTFSCIIKCPYHPSLSAIIFYQHSQSSCSTIIVNRQNKSSCSTVIINHQNQFIFSGINISCHFFHICPLLTVFVFAFSTSTTGHLMQPVSTRMVSFVANSASRQHHLSRSTNH